MKNIILLSALCTVVTHAADQTQSEMLRCHVRIYQPCLRIRDNLGGESLIMYLPERATWYEWADIIRQKLQIEGSITGVARAEDPQTNNVLFCMRSHRKNPDTRNAE